MDYFYYDIKAVNYLSDRDAKMGALIKRVGHIDRQVNTNRFESLITQVIAQQISKKAAITVLGRLKTLAPRFDAKHITSLSVEKIQGCGMTFRKANNIKHISEMIHENKFSLEVLDSMNNEQVIKQLATLPGIGVWTAEMYLIFTLLRQDVISYGDLAIRQGIMKLYNLDGLSKKEFKEYELIYGEYASVASLYLWYLAHE